MQRVGSNYQKIAFLAVGVFYTLILIFAVNIPQQDDYDAILTYLLLSQDSFFDGLFDIHVSHRLSITRILAKLTLALGGVNFKIMATMGASSLLCVALLLYRSIPTVLKLSDRHLLLSVLCLNTFSLFHWSNMVWATASVQNYGSLFLAVSSFYLFNKKTTRELIFAILLGLIAPYLNSSALLLLPILCFWSLAEIFYSQGSYKKILATGAATLFSFLVFFNFLPGQANAEVLPDLVLHTEMIISVLRSYLIATAGYLHFDIPALVAGAIINIYFMILVRFRYYKKNGVIFYTFLYLMLSIMLIALFRHESGIRQIIASRYQIYTLTLNSLIVISFFEMDFQRYIRVPFFRQILLSAFALLYLASFYYVSNLASEREKIWNGLRNWNTAKTPSLYHPRPERASEVLSLAINAGIYSLPQSFNKQPLD